MIDHLDHLVLTTIDVEACKDFYTRIMGMRVETFGEGGSLSTSANKNKRSCSRS